MKETHEKVSSLTLHTHLRLHIYSLCRRSSKSKPFWEPSILERMWALVSVSRLLLENVCAQPFQLMLLWKYAKVPFMLHFLTRYMYIGLVWICIRPWKCGCSIWLEHNIPTKRDPSYRWKVERCWTQFRYCAKSRAWLSRVWPLYCFQRGIWG